MKVIYSILTAVVSVCVIAGCSAKIKPTVSMDRQQRYGSLAIVCAPKEGANPSYGPLILKQSEKMISYLDFLEKVDCLADVWVDTNSTPPGVDLTGLSGYDAVVSLVYSYESGHVYFNFHMMDFPDSGPNMVAISLLIRSLGPFIWYSLSGVTKFKAFMISSISLDC